MAKMLNYDFVPVLEALAQWELIRTLEQAARFDYGMRASRAAGIASADSLRFIRCNVRYQLTLCKYYSGC
ncbi:MAG: hypothetical protein KAU50_11265, partial [Candidatus Marinimicrobia bacterium]|nr:hypothetical protein [Candidatus Neomarinimicrobiota bacterium]